MSTPTAIGRLWQWIKRRPAAMRQTFVHTPGAIELAWQSSATMTVAILVLTLAVAVMPVGVAFLGKLIIDAVVAQSREQTLKWVGVELLLICVQALFLRLLFLLRGLLGARLGLDVNVKILRKALSLELRDFEDPATYDKLTRARREASSRPVAVVTDFLQMLQNVATLIGYVALLISFSGWAVVGLVLAALPATISEMRFAGAVFRIRNWRSPDTRRLNYVEHVLANDGHAKELKVYGLGETLMDRYTTLGEKFYTEDRALNIRRSGWAYLLSLLATAAFYGCYLVMALAAASGNLTLGNLTLYVVAFRQGQQAFQSCLTAISSMYEHNLYMANLFDFLRLPTRPKAIGRSPALLQPVEKTGFVFENIGFRYPGRDTWALRGINIKIPAGQSLALVGHNGAGKSTFIKLICRLYDPSEGRILLDGVDLQEWDWDALQKRFGVVFQDFNRYQLSFGENIGMGSITHLAAEQKILRAVQQGGADDILKDLPEGLATPLGRWFQKGVELSGGQWQKIALARAFMREDADILVLDEPTAALDAEAEHAVFERFRNLTKGRTAILISHRFPTVRMADRIVVIEGGKVVETGTHEELMAKNGRYGKLFALQASGYL